MATAPELLKTSAEVVIRPMRATDVAEVVAIERSAYQFPWSEGIFIDCLRVGYVCRVVTMSRKVLGYGVMSVGAGEAHILNLCVHEAFRCRGLGKRVLRSLIARAACPCRWASSRSAAGAATIRRRPVARMLPCSSSLCASPTPPWPELLE